MTGRRFWTVSTGCVALLVLIGAVTASSSAAPAPAGRPAVVGSCVPGGRTLSTYGDHVYPDTGNSGYTSVHTDVHTVYDAASNQFLPGTHVDLSDQATRCLTEFSLDFERHSAFPSGPDMTVGSVEVNGRPVAFRFVQPTYPGDPNGPNDPDPRAHEASQNTPVGGPANNPLPPACSPELPPNDAPDALDGTPCPANKLVVTPAQPIRAGAAFVVTVHYAGRPGVHEDGDGTTEGWFRSDSPKGDGGFVTTEPVGTEDWMPLNDHPSAKPTYDFYDTVAHGKTAVANGTLVSRHGNAPSTDFPAGSTTWHWHMGSPVPSYLVENSIGGFDLRVRRAANGLRFYEVQASSLSPARKRENRAIMNQQQDITQFESQFNGPYPFTSAGVLIGLPPAGFEEEMETMITFPDGRIDLGTLYHENMHQWWGDNVTEANYNLTFYKEGFATLGEFLFGARLAEAAAGGPSTAAGRAAFNANLVHQFDSNYALTTIWAGAPSNPTPDTLFSGSSTYVRPGITYLALRQILGATNFTDALRYLQRTYGGRTVTEPELEAAFRQRLPVQSRACHAHLSEFFTQWFDTSYPTAAGATEPTITGPGLDGPGFYGHHDTCT